MVGQLNISREELIALVAGGLTGERARAVEDQAENDPELAAQIWLLKKFGRFSPDARREAVRLDGRQEVPEPNTRPRLTTAPPRAPRRTSWPWYARAKAPLEFLVACLLLVLVAPVLLLAALLVKLTSRGPAFYSQARLGYRGRPFRMYKLRTMYHECEKHSGPRWSTARDPRITSVGHFLRRTHLDELPQLLNVLRGEMSLIGPRPERPEFVPHLEQAIPHYRRRLLVRPGVTGLAQVQFFADTDLESVRRKVAYDLYYVCKQGPWLDLRILLCTFPKVLGLPVSAVSKLTALLGKLMALPTAAAVVHNYTDQFSQRRLWAHPQTA
jgi:lipopolysaccharide/colanic/teichoic acid biosynthesis glycosyltransferase